MQSAHSLIEHITSITSQRDLDLLSFSLLRSVNSLLKPLSVKVLTLDSKNKPTQEIKFNNNDCQVLIEGLEVDPQLLNVFEKMALSDSSKYKEKLSDEENLYVYLMGASRKSTTYLVMVLKQRVSHAEDFLMSGILEIFKNFCDLLKYSQTDELTGLANRKTFEMAINRIFEIMQADPDYDPTTDKRSPPSENSTYWLVLLDIDYFKKINDQMGHLYGDEVLVKLAQLLLVQFREQDLLFRFGGEEFVVLMRCKDQKACAVALERMRINVEQENFPGDLKVTISGGAVEIDRDSFHVTLLDYADQALYKSKENGRNQITFFEDMVSKGEAEYEKVMDGDVELF